MPIDLTSLVALLFAFFWIILSIIYLTQNAKKGRLSPFKFAAVLAFGFSFIISITLFVTIATAQAISFRDIGFVFFVFFFNMVISFPVVYYSSKFLLEKHFINWSSQNKDINT